MPATEPVDASLTGLAVAVGVLTEKQNNTLDAVKEVKDLFVDVSTRLRVVENKQAQQDERNAADDKRRTPWTALGALIVSIVVGGLALLDRLFTG